MIRLKLNSMSGSQCDPRVTEGFICDEKPYSEVHNGEFYEGVDLMVTYPELGPARLYDEWPSGGIVAPIAGRMYRIQLVASSEDDDSYGFEGQEPYLYSCSEVTFEEVSEDETPFKPFDVKTYAAEIRAGRIASFQKTIEDIKALLEAEQDPEIASHHEHFLRSYEEDLRRAEAETGWRGYSAPKMVKLFGQPAFIQDEYTPAHNGRPGMALATLETGWGDSGNENLMIALDDEGYPAAAWFEASCC